MREKAFNYELKSLDKDVRISEENIVNNSKAIERLEKLTMKITADLEDKPSLGSFDSSIKDLKDETAKMKLDALEVENKLRAQLKILEHNITH